MKRFEVGKFDNETLAPDAANYRDRLLKQIARADSGDKTDLAPILRGIGNLTGTKLAEGYETNDARSNRLSELLGASNIKTSGVYDKNDRTLIDLYKGQKLPPSMVSASSSTDLPRAVSSGSGGSQAARLNASLEDKIRKEVFDKVIAKYSDKQQGFDQLDEAFSRNDLQSIRANLSVFAKTVGKEAGVLTDQDVTRVLPANIATTLAGIEAYFADTPTAKLDPAFSKGLRELTALAKKKTREKYSNDLEALRASFGSEGSSYKKFMGENMPGSAIFSQADKMFKSSDRVKSEGLLSSEASQNWLKQKRSGKK